MRLIGVCVALALANGFALGSDQPKGRNELRDVRAARARRIILIPQENKMVCVARVLDLNDQRFAMGIPECIAEAGGRIVNHTMVERLHWDGPDANGAVTCQWVDENIDYCVRIVPDYDSVDITMTIRNLTGRDWVDVYSFNCLNPVAAPDYKDWTLERTYMSKEGSPFRMDGTTRINDGPNKTVQFYLHEDYENVSPHVTGFKATSPDKTDGSYIVTMSEDGQSYMAATSPKAAFLFNNLDRCCIHSAPNFGDIRAGGQKTVTVRFYLAYGTLEDFLVRYFTDFPTDIHGVRIKNAAGRVVALMNEAGNLIMPGSLTENSTPTGSEGSDVLVKDMNGDIKAAMDSSGNLVLAGSVHEKHGALSPPTGSLVFKEPGGAVVGYISASGDLFLKGEVFGGT